MQTTIRTAGSAPMPDPIVLSAHELRNVAASIYGCAHTLYDADLTPAERAEMLEVIIRQATRLTALTEGR